ncbi:hypothetical protein H2200_005973 [Cladophialophora chaetospira]|uniref:Uncharacterized protein n=1 Tax=Cladophialophora chaetospira TaxID=386627 RepID=A0AA39CIU3_9EURO|nr:hypothetical protein H2200_005973 [Cladophialophora chaetospira]
MSVYQLFFVFGKTGTYLLDHPQGCVRRNCPQELVAKLDSLRIQQIESLALDANGNFFLRGTDNAGRIWCYRGGEAVGTYATLEDIAYKNGALTPHEIRATYGSAIGHVAAWSGNGSWRWFSHDNIGIPDWVMKDPRHIKQVALGLDRSWFVLWTDGHCDYACGNSYPELYHSLQNQRRGDVVFVAMKPHRENEYFIALADGRVHIRASAICEADVVHILSTYDQLEVISSEVSNFSHRVVSQPSIPQRARKREFLNGLVQNVGGGIVSAIVTTVLTASCCVM